MDLVQDMSVATLPMALMPEHATVPAAAKPHPSLLDLSSFIGRLGRGRAVQGPEARLRDALVESRRNARVCPRQAAWLRSCVGEGHCLRGQVVSSRTLAELTAGPAPASLLEQRKRLGQQLAWAARHGLIDEAYDYLHHLQESQWLHFDDDDTAAHGPRGRI